MLTTVLMFIAAMALSAVAGYYSVIGMTSIFAGAFYPIVIMTGILETSKVIVASWLYNNWQKTPLALRSYLTLSVVVLMLITSMGIFGYLSKAHIEQAAAGQEQQAQLEKIGKQIDNQSAIIAQANDKLTNMGKQGSAANEAINTRIADANKIIETANQQIQPAIDEQQKIIDAANAKVELRAKGIQAQIDDIDKQVANLDAIIKTLIDQKRTTTATNRQADQKPQRAELAKQKAALIKQIDDLRNAKDPTVDAAKAEIARLRAKVDDQVKQARELINTLTSKLESGTDVNKMQGDIDTLNARIKSAQDEIDQLTTDKFKIEAESRKLEVEVGPLKYIAQLIYGDNPEANLLERAVRYVILTIIFVFDPLAVLMLIAANQGIAAWRESRRKPTLLGTVIDSLSPTEMPAADTVQPAATLQFDHSDLTTAMDSLRQEITHLRDNLSTLRIQLISDESPKSSVDQDSTGDDISDDDPPRWSPVQEDKIPDATAESDGPGPHDDGYIGLARTIPDAEPEIQIQTIEPIELESQVDVQGDSTRQPRTADELFEVLRQRHQARIDKHMATRG